MIARSPGGRVVFVFVLLFLFVERVVRRVL